MDCSTIRHGDSLTDSFLTPMVHSSAVCVPPISTAFRPARPCDREDKDETNEPIVTTL